MDIRQQSFSHTPTTPAELADVARVTPHLVLVFGAVARLTAPGLVDVLKAAFGDAELIGCSTAGEISNDGVNDDSLVVTAVRFADPALRVVATGIHGMDDSAAAGERLASQLAQPELHNVVVFGTGVNINGSALIKGLRARLPAEVMLSGGLAGDGGAFRETFTLCRRGVSSHQLVALGFYSPLTRLHHGSFGGWQPFGPARQVTRAAGNLLYELDGEPALDVYKRYLGEYARDLPASGLLFPFEMLGEDHAAVGLIRTILGVNEADGSLILAGDIIEHGYLRLMHATTDSLVNGAQAAAEHAALKQGARGESLALLVSCVGRKLVMGARVDEEVEAVADVFGHLSQVAGFYSYGEISPLFPSTDCKLHNQTMTITHISEA